MTDFFEKLKKGMDVNEPIEESTEGPVEEISMELTSVQSVNEESEEPEEVPKKKKPEKVKKKKEKRAEKVEVEEQEEKPRELKEETSDLFEDFEGELTVDVFQKDKELIVQSAIAGIEPEDLDIAIEDDLLIIKGKRERRFTEEKENYFFQECYWGRFKREILLPVEVDSSRINAKLEKGILTIKIPIIKREHKTKISVE
ncbi:Hsp20/alpha crystallin family protein [Patescibacteria group bacterium]|nr:Hsp20/alpha crystallin family protein [Patescibacteria group bacterium]